jgi:5-methylcytosine-specific restriction enzyme A
MKLELLIGGITLFIIANIYYDGKLINIIKSYNKFDKFYQMGLMAFFGLCFYLYIKKSPGAAKDILYNANSYVKFLPVDKNTSTMLTPFIDFTGKSLSNTLNNNYPRVNNINTNLTPQQQKILTSGTRSNKRSVSETKKKFVAANQSWRCKHCNTQLSAWFEVDHVKKLEYGGSNEISNLEALCRECHGKKTAFENL